MNPVSAIALPFLQVPESAAAPQQRSRSAVPEAYRWNLADIYSSDEVWRAQKAKLVADIPRVAAYRGCLGESPQTLRACLDLVTLLGKEYARLFSYASMHSDEDTRDTAYLAMEQEMGQVGADLSAQASFIQPEILEVGREKVEAFLADEPGLEIYRHGLDDILRRKDHTGTEGEEKILANASLIADSPHGIYSLFSNADFPFAEITLSDGKTVRLTQANFSLHRASTIRDDRRSVFASYFGRLKDFRRTFGAQLYAEVKKNMFFARARRYRSCIERALDGSNIPLAVYRQLVDNVNAHLGTFHRSLHLRRKLLGLNELHYYDLYCPVVPAIDLTYTFDEAREHVLASLRPLGGGYGTVARRAFDERWLDVFPTEGKRSGAYSNGACYDVHPYILLNYNGKYDDVSTLAHELGHTMHSHLSNSSQPYATADYSIFVAEVASTMNEALLTAYMLGIIQDDTVRLSLLGNYLDGIRATVFRQTQFAEFELRIHECAERGESLTGDSLSEMYDDIVKRYYGHDAGACVVDDEIRYEWAHVPHFFYNFYVYQYATSFTASTALAERILSGDGDVTRRYRDLLSAGGSDYPMDLLRRAGVDMSTAEPFELTMSKMNRIMDEIERITGHVKV